MLLTRASNPAHDQFLREPDLKDLLGKIERRDCRAAYRSPGVKTVMPL